MCLPRLLSREIGGEGFGLPLLERHGDPKLLEILLEGPAAQVDLVVGEEGTYVTLPLRADEAGDALIHARVGALGILPCHGLPAALHEVPGEPAPVHAPEEAADHVRGVLAADLPVEGHLEGLPEKLGRAEAGQRVQVALLLLGRAGTLEALPELRVFGLATPRGENGDDGRQDVGVHGSLVRAIARVDFTGARLDLRVVAEG